MTGNGRQSKNLDFAKAVRIREIVDFSKRIRRAKQIRHKRFVNTLYHRNMNKGVYMKKFLIFLITLVVIGLGAFAYQNRAFLHRVAKDSIVNYENWKEADSVKSGAPIVKNELLFVFTGIDKNTESDGLNSPTRTDTIMLVKVNFDTGNVNFINIPRDSRVEINGEMHKINAAHAYGGMPLTLDTIGNLFGIKVDKYVKLSFESVEVIVDAIGGIDVDLNPAVAQSLGLSPGVHHLNGKQALDYVRFRHGYQTGDYGRVQAQQQFMISLAKQCLASENLLKLPGIYSTVSKYMDTNIEESSIMDWIKLAQNMNVGEVSASIVEGHAEMIDGISYWIIDDNSVKYITERYLKAYKK